MITYVYQAWIEQHNSILQYKKLNQFLFPGIKFSKKKTEIELSQTIRNNLSNGFRYFEFDLDISLDFVKIFQNFQEFIEQNNQEILLIDLKSNKSLNKDYLKSISQVLFTPEKSTSTIFNLSLHELRTNFSKSGGIIIMQDASTLELDDELREYCFNREHLISKNLKSTKNQLNSFNSLYFDDTELVKNKNQLSVLDLSYLNQFNQIELPKNLLQKIRNGNFGRAWNVFLFNENSLIDGINLLPTVISINTRGWFRTQASKISTFTDFIQLNLSNESIEYLGVISNESEFKLFVQTKTTSFIARRKSENFIISSIKLMEKFDQIFVSNYSSDNLNNWAKISRDKDIMTIHLFNESSPVLSISSPDMVEQIIDVSFENGILEIIYLVNNGRIKRMLFDSTKNNSWLIPIEKNERTQKRELIRKVENGEYEQFSLDQNGKVIHKTNFRSTALPSLAKCPNELIYSYSLNNMLHYVSKLKDTFEEEVFEFPTKIKQSTLIKFKNGANHLFVTEENNSTIKWAIKDYHNSFK